MDAYLNTRPKQTNLEWLDKNNALLEESGIKVFYSRDARQESRYLRDKIYNRTKWDQNDNNNRLADRVDDVRRWKIWLEKDLENLEEEINKLNSSKEKLEEQIDSKVPSLEIILETEVVRDRRKGNEMIADEIEASLEEEKEILSGSKSRLQKLIDQTNDIMCQLKLSRQRISADIQDKEIAIDIDVDQYNLNENSGLISFKPDPLRVAKGSVSLQEWQDFSIRNRNEVFKNMKKSQKMRETNDQILKKIEIDLISQRDFSDFQLRKKIHDLEKTIDELDWQKLQVEEEKKQMEDEIKNTDAAIRAKIKPAKLAQTRMEKRTERPNMEKCLDSPFYGLSDEVRQVEASKQALQNKLFRNQHLWNELDDRILLLEKDIEQKKKILDLEKRCLGIRQKNKSDEPSKMDCKKNLIITGLHDEKI